tara:strand:- start:135 stop:1151 length:1017 start_codon:yes stop_codon:yes gene_type:complete
MSSYKPKKCPACGDKDIDSLASKMEKFHRSNLEWMKEHGFEIDPEDLDGIEEGEYDSRLFECNSCNYTWADAWWRAKWSEEEISPFYNALKNSLPERQNEYIFPDGMDSIYQLKNRKAVIHEASCYFCNRTEKQWNLINSKIIKFLDSQSKRTKDAKKIRESQINDAIHSFEKLWSKVDKKLKPTTILSDVELFLPKEMADRLDDGVTLEMDNLIDLALRWLYQCDPELKVKKFEKKMMKEIIETFRENFGSNIDLSIDEQLIVENILSDRLSDLHNKEMFGLRKISWKPWFHRHIAFKGNLYREKDTDFLGIGKSNPVSELLNLELDVCPLCLNMLK